MSIECKKCGEIVDALPIHRCRPPKPVFRLESFRSGGFINKDPDIARISVDLPIIEAKKLLAKLNAG